MVKENLVKPEFDPDMNPVDFFNLTQSWDEVMKYFRKVKKISDHEYCCPKDSRETRKTADFSVNGDGMIRVNGENGYNLPVGKKYTKFQFFSRVKFRGNYKAAITNIEHEKLNSHIPYVRIGCDYFKVYEQRDRYGISGKTLKGWKKDEIKQDHGKDSLMYVKTYDDFCIIPDNKNQTPFAGTNYNLYNEFRHKPKKGATDWSEYMMKQVFGDQIDLGWRYMKLLYEYPERYAPILVLVSKKRQTGKSTFINWLNMIFGANMVIISSKDLESSFNHIYATANIIAIEESFIDKKHVVEKLKALSTQKEIVVNQKFVSNYKIPFYGKFILTSNNEDKFAIIDEDEIRFFVRKLGDFEKVNHNIENDLAEEIPAFLSYLENKVPEIDFSVSRTGFTFEELNNESLETVVKESRSWLYKDLEIIIDDYMNNHLPSGLDGFYASPTDIKNKFYSNNNQVQHSYIAKILREDFKMQPVCEQGKTMRYDSIIDNFMNSKVGNPYFFTKNEWMKGTEDESQSVVAQTVNSDEQLPF